MYAYAVGYDWSQCADENKLGFDFSYIVLQTIEEMDMVLRVSSDNHSSRVRGYRNRSRGKALLVVPGSLLSTASHSKVFCSQLSGIQEGMDKRYTEDRRTDFRGWMDSLLWTDRQSFYKGISDGPTFTSV